MKIKLKVTIEGSYLLDNYLGNHKFPVHPIGNPIDSFIKRCLHTSISNLQQDGMHYNDTALLLHRPNTIDKDEMYNLFTIQYREKIPFESEKKDTFNNLTISIDTNNDSTTDSLNIYMIDSSPIDTTTSNDTTNNFNQDGNDDDNNNNNNSNTTSNSTTTTTIRTNQEDFTLPKYIIKKKHIYEKTITNEILQFIIKSNSQSETYSFTEFYKEFYENNNSTTSNDFDNQNNNDESVLYLYITIRENFDSSNRIMYPKSYSMYYNEFTVITYICYKTLKKEQVYQTSKDNNDYLFKVNENNRHFNVYKKNNNLYYIRFYYESYKDLLDNINIENENLPEWMIKYHDSNRYRRTKGIMPTVLL